MLEAIKNPIYIEHELKQVFIVKPTFSKYTEADEVCCGLIKFKITNEDQWSDLCNYQKEQYNPD